MPQADGDIYSVSKETITFSFITLAFALMNFCIVAIRIPFLPFPLRVGILQFLICFQREILNGRQSKICFAEGSVFRQALHFAACP